MGKGRKKLHFLRVGVERVKVCWDVSGEGLRVEGWDGGLGSWGGGTLEWMEKKVGRKWVAGGPTERGKWLVGVIFALISSLNRRRAKRICETYCPYCALNTL